MYLRQRRLAYNASLANGLMSLLKRAFQKLVYWHFLMRTRRQLSKLSDAALADIGLTRDAALQEAMRPFWDNELAKTKH